MQTRYVLWFYIILANIAVGCVCVLRYRNLQSNISLTGMLYFGCYIIWLCLFTFLKKPAADGDVFFLLRCDRFNADIKIVGTRSHVGLINIYNILTYLLFIITNSVHSIISIKQHSTCALLNSSLLDVVRWLYFVIRDFPIFSDSASLPILYIWSCSTMLSSRNTVG